MASGTPIGQSYDPAVEGRGRRAGAYLFAKGVMKLIGFIFMRKEWRGWELIPKTGPAIIAINHISGIDPVNVALFVDRSGRHPRFMAKSELFGNKFLKYFLENTGQIPVYRESREAGEALSAAIKRLEAGGCVLVYPEGTITKDPHGWPMVSRSGIARLVLATGAPVIPVAQWGARGIPGAWKPWKRVRIQMSAAAALDLSAYTGKKQTVEVMNQITDEVVEALRHGVQELRGEPCPDVIWDNRLKQHVPFKAAREGGAA